MAQFKKTQQFNVTSNYDHKKSKNMCFVFCFLFDTKNILAS